MRNKETVLYEDIRDINDVDFIPWGELKNKTILVTGATGLIGTTLIKALLYCNKERLLGIKIIALVRDIAKAKEKFSKCESDNGLIFIVGTIEHIPAIEGNVDYIIHGASQTDSKEMIIHAVETIRTAVDGTENMLELAKGKKVKSFIFLSSMEVYGYPERGHKVKEYETGALSPLELRNSYPISKQLCESLCCAYAGEYDVPTKIIRLTQTFGPGVNYNDTRIFAYFARCIIEGKDIVLKTKGETERCYLYLADAVTAILTVLLKGTKGQAYNAADSKTYCSIAEMADGVAKDGGVNVLYELEDNVVNGFPNTLYMDLDTSLLEDLGWKPLEGGRTICKMYRRMIDSL